MHSHAILLPLLSVFLPPTTSHPTTSLQARQLPPPNTAVCTGVPSPVYFWAHYALHIGVPYAAGSGCGAIQNHLTSTLGSSPQPMCGINTVGVRGGRPVCNFKCVAEGGQEEGTILEFDVSLGQGDDVNKALGELYPMVGGGFQCPDVTS
ncbi:hypothetical protein CERZMDRAFT_98792 [Cercospora zeae-maydis SCOH1-5]|uniref:Ecp2 effector protein domain-containing protein n=1 Tax=Cercospora zeae-maydis SCOH1-5 TaxID=717836 RepID=A0A6A6FCE3_9PEZI|nr:hypothetical protein CERZMDRAFT_98792 [Cercospora zeae-maydis SCOH1-5]